MWDNCKFFHISTLFLQKCIDNLLTKLYNVIVEYLFAKRTDFANAERKLQNSGGTSVRHVAQLFAKEVFCELDIPPRRTWAKGGIVMKLTLIP